MPKASTVTDEMVISGRATSSRMTTRLGTSPMARVRATTGKPLSSASTEVASGTCWEARVSMDSSIRGGTTSSAPTTAMAASTTTSVKNLIDGGPVHR